MKKKQSPSYNLLQELGYFTPEKNHNIPHISSINNSLEFTDETLCETIYYNRTNERLGVHVKEGSRFTVYALPNLQNLLAQLAGKKKDTQSSCKFLTNKIRFLVTTEKQLYFALEGTPNSIVPAHYQMSSDTKANAQCLTAGNIYLKESASGFKIKKINHKSGDFTPCFDSLKWVLAVLLANESLLDNFIPETLEIEAIDGNGGPTGSYFISKQDLTKLLAPHIQLVSQISPCSTNKLEPDYHKPSGEPPISSRFDLKDSFASLNVSIQNPLELSSESAYEDESDSLISENEIECFNTPKGKNQIECFNTPKGKNEIECFHTPKGNQLLKRFWHTPIQSETPNLSGRDSLNNTADSLDFSPIPSYN